MTGPDTTCTPHAIGIDVGGSAIKIGRVDAAGRLLAQRSIPTPAGPDAAIAAIADVARELIANAGDTPSAIVGVGIGTPGPLSPRRGIVFNAANLPGWKNVPVRDSLAQRLHLPVVFDNDANMAAFGEYWCGAGATSARATANPTTSHPETTPKAPVDPSQPPTNDTPHDDMVMLTLGTGVGCGIIVGGRVLHGHFENAAEVGHMIVEIDGLPCPCGQRGCLEQYASAAGVARRVAHAIESGEPCMLKTRLRSGQAIDSETVVDAARTGDALCTKIIDQACAYLGMACVNLQHVVNPARIVLGGGLARAGDFLIDRVRQAVRDTTWSLCPDQPDIACAALGYDAGVIGAAGRAITEVTPST